MNSESNAEVFNADYKNWLEYDYNPFFVFAQNGNVLYLNRAAELLSGYEPVKTFNNLALSYAPIDFGYKTTFMQLGYGKFHFFAVTVGYEDENVIGIKLYQNPASQENSVEIIKTYDLTNMYVLIDIALTLAKAKLNDTLFRNEFDPCIPEFKLSQNDFTKVLRKIYDTFDRKCPQITTVLKLKIGEFLYVGGCKYPLVEMNVKGAFRDSSQDTTIETLAGSINISTQFETDAIMLEIPMIV